MTYMALTIDAIYLWLSLGIFSDQHRSAILWTDRCGVVSRSVDRDHSIWSASTELRFWWFLFITGPVGWRTDGSSGYSGALRALESALSHLQRKYVTELSWHCCTMYYIQPDRRQWLYSVTIIYTFSLQMPGLRWPPKSSMHFHRKSWKED